MLYGPHSTPIPLRPPALWTFFGRFVHGDLVRQFEYLTVENEILRTHIPKQRVRVTPAASANSILHGFGRSEWVSARHAQAYAKQGDQHL